MRNFFTFLFGAWDIYGIIVSLIGSATLEGAALMAWEIYDDVPIYLRVAVGVLIIPLVVCVVALLFRWLQRGNAESSQLTAETHGDNSPIVQAGMVGGNMITTVYTQAQPLPTKKPSIKVTPYFDKRYANLIVENTGDNASFTAQLFNLVGIAVTNPEAKFPTGYSIRWFGNARDKRSCPIDRESNAVLEVFDAHSHKRIYAESGIEDDDYVVQQVNLFSYNRTFDGEMPIGGIVTFSLRITSEPEMNTPFSMNYKLLCGKDNEWLSFDETSS